MVEGELTYIELDELGRRQGHLLSLNGYTHVHTGAGPQQGERYIDAKSLDITVAAFLAWKDFQSRRGHILPQLPSLLKDCDFQMTFEARDPKFSRAESIRQALLATVDRPAGTQHPFAVVGPLDSSVTETVNALVGGGLGVAMISGDATSDALLNAPLFSRTAPSNKVEARATMAYLHQLGVTRVAYLYYVDDALGIGMHKNLQEAAHSFGITLLPFAIQRNTNAPERGIRQTLRKLRASQAKYVVAVLEDVDYKGVARVAYQEKMMGLGQQLPVEFAWFMVGFSDWADPSFSLGWVDADVAKALHGVGMIHLHLNPKIAFDVAMRHFSQSPESQQELLEHIQEPELFQNYTYQATTSYQQFQYFTYDAVIAMGLAACRTSGMFSGSQLHESFKGLNFEGVSGQIDFDPHTGIRSSGDFILRVNNILLSEERSTTGRFRFENQVVAEVTGDNVNMINPFSFANNSTIQLPDHPPFESYDYNLIPRGLQVFCLCMAAFVALLSFVFMAWTYWHRKKFIVAAAQPIFLVQLAVGTIIMATAIIPLSMQGKESTPALDRSCMAVPWLFFIGLVVAISAILCKTWRLEQIVDGANHMRHTRVEAKAVIAPFLLLLVWNVSMLIGWTLIAPQKYKRIPVDNYDSYGRSVESFGSCQPVNNWAWFFRCSIMASLLLAIFFVIQKCYRVRNKSSYFAETKSLAWSMASLLETTVVFAPLIVAARDNPSTFYAALAGLVSIACLSFILPIFRFKVQHVNAEYKDAQRDEIMIEALAEFAVSGMDSFARYSDDGSAATARGKGRMNVVRKNSNPRQDRMSFDQITQCSFCSKSDCTGRKRCATSASTGTAPPHH